MKRVIRYTLAALVAILLGFIAVYVWVLATPHPLTDPVAVALPWPVVCSTRNCITTQQWQHQFETEMHFSESTERATPTPADVLTTLVRQQLVHLAVVPSPITATDAARYRTEVLNLTNEFEIADSTGLTIDQYDREVIVPFLEQEALLEQRETERLSDLYVDLSKDRWLIILPFGLSWDDDTARVIEKR